MIEEPVISLQLENEQLSLMMIMEHTLSFQYKTYWKKYDLKNALKKKFSDKNPWHIVLICARRFWWLATHQPQSAQNTPSLEYKVDEQPPTWPILCRQ